jgi:hypothetical protein
MAAQCTGTLNGRSVSHRERFGQPGDQIRILLGPLIGPEKRKPAPGRAGPLLSWSGLYGSWLSHLMKESPPGPPTPRSLPGPPSK